MYDDLRLSLPPTVDRAAVLERLDRVLDPELDESILKLGFVESLEVELGRLTVELRLPTYWCAPNFSYLMAEDARRELLTLENVESVTVQLKDHFASDSIAEEREAKCETLRGRAERVHAVANAPRFAESWEVYPFNSGYFMCVKVRGVEAEALRLHLLDEYGIGLIATGAHDIRVAFSCLEVDEVEPVFEALHEAIQKLQ